MRLGERLGAIAEFVKPGTTIVDVGTDHAYLPIFLVGQNKITSAVAGEVNRGPYLSAEAMLKKMRLEKAISLRFGDGLAVVSPGEVHTAVIAGMGGPTIIEILTKQPLVTEKLERLILQPMIAASLVREWLTANGWQIVDETLVRDEGRLYEIIVAEQGEVAKLSAALNDIGPVLWEKKPPLLKEHITNLIAQVENVLTQMAASEEAKQSAKYKLYQARKRELEEKATCL